MKVLFTTDKSGLELDTFDRVILPINRCETIKVAEVAARCRSNNIQYSWQIRENDAKLLMQEGLDPYPLIHGDIGVSWFYTMLFPFEIWGRLQIINFHAGDPGPHALKKAIELGLPTIRCIWHWVDSGVDTGKVIAESTINLPTNFDKARKWVIEEGTRLFKEDVHDFRLRQEAI